MKRSRRTPKQKVGLAPSLEPPPGARVWEITIRGKNDYQFSLDVAPDHHLARVEQGQWDPCSAFEFIYHHEGWTVTELVSYTLRGRRWGPYCVLDAKLVEYS